jgi:hypothetical protein
LTFGAIRLTPGRELDKLNRAWVQIQKRNPRQPEVGREPGLWLLRRRMRVGVDRFQATGADVGINFRRLFNLEPGAYHTEASVEFNLRRNPAPLVDDFPSPFAVNHLFFISVRVIGNIQN